MAQREGARGYEPAGEENGSASPLSDLMPIPPVVQRTIWTIEPTEELDPAAAEMWQRISLTACLVKYPTSGDVKSFGEFVGGYAATHWRRRLSSTCASDRPRCLDTIGHQTDSSQ
jgi:hypothetical protein